VNSNRSVTLAPNVENLLLTGAGNINGTGNALDNVITGNAGANVLSGLSGSDTLAGGAGADVLMGGAGNDTYLYNLGDGADTVVESDTTAGNHDVLSFGSTGTAISQEQLWFSQSGNDLLVSVIGTADSVTLTNWYQPGGDGVDEFRVSDGSVLTDAQVQNLVAAMSSFTPPPAGTTSLDASYQPVLDAIAASWS
jgi:Ca2+-binding RTX toxin-like protein